MKPYFLVIYNFIKFQAKRLLVCSACKASPVTLLGFNTRVDLHRSSQLILGEKVVSDGRFSLIIDAGARVEIGSKVYFNEGAMLSCKAEIKIGEGCQFGPNVKIFDNDHCFNETDGVLTSHTCKPIEIGDRCWIGSNVVILKGSKIGKNCVIGAGAVIKGEIPDGSLVTQERNLIIRSIGKMD